ncbi:hypothetical protein BFV65_13450 [Enterobacter hormaechei subsp. hoffmannii]|uniref:beta-1,6-N-acetylglucosaminyltransferase n=2 Tax=Enterobacter hormaechei TaxID=158836 RepID=UPI00084CE386|nr:beta-1,6-N-acetylglucosaminyltransferase [Enterobacter hormaechei]AOQ00565.1 hypothetical protein BFV65_13450 [Enterobacter hormaechei subsp. hoffmannii]RCA18265.1 hypothetical protein C6A49_17900 [Enterobacter hormaechei]
MHAFLIQTHKFTVQFATLCKLLNEHGNVYIHVDAKYEDIYQAIKNFVQDEKLTKITVLEDRQKIFWGHYSQLKAIYALLKESFKICENKYFTHISGECFPLKNLSLFIAEVNNKNKNLISYSNQEKMRFRVENLNLFVNSSIFSKKVLIRKLSLFLGFLLAFFGIKNTTFHGQKIYKGSPWFTLKRETVSWLLNSNIDKKISKMDKSVCADEVFFHTLIANSIWKKEIVSDNLFYIKWTGSKNPLYLKHDEDFPLDRFWGRKFSMNEEELIIFLNKHHEINGKDFVND